MVKGLAGAVNEAGLVRDSAASALTNGQWVVVTAG